MDRRDRWQRGWLPWKKLLGLANWKRRGGKFLWFGLPYQDWLGLKVIKKSWVERFGFRGSCFKNEIHCERPIQIRRKLRFGTNGNPNLTSSVAFSCWTSGSPNSIWKKKKLQTTMHTNYQILFWEAVKWNTLLSLQYHYSQLAITTIYQKQANPPF